MKQLFIIPLLFIGIFSNAQQTEVMRKHAIKTNMLSAIYNTLNISYEKLKTNGNSLLIGASYMDFDDFGENDYNYNNNSFTKVEGVSLTGEYRLHFSGQGFEGGYVGGFGRAMYYSRVAEIVNYNYQSFRQPGSTDIDIIKEKFNYISVGIGFVVGYQYVIKNRITFDLFGGPVYQYLIHEDRKTRNLNTGANIQSQDETLLAERIPNKYIRGYGLRGGITVGILF
jgi:hypothetical protein